MSTNVKGNPAVSSTPVSPPPLPFAAPTDDQIRGRAFEIYCARNGFNGTADNDWLQAERELRDRTTVAPAESMQPRMPLVATHDECSTIKSSRAALQLQPA